jgi:hypothetical protein
MPKKKHSNTYTKSTPILILGMNGRPDMNEKIMADILQLISIFFFLAFVLASLLISVGVFIQVIRWIYTNWKTLREANWLGVLMILGIILLFMRYGPIIIF